MKINIHKIRHKIKINKKPGLIAVSVLVVLITAATATSTMVLNSKKDTETYINEGVFQIPIEAYKNLEKKESKTEKCSGFYEIKDIPNEENTRCTYGPEVSFVNSVDPGRRINVAGPGVQCYGDNQSGMRVQAVYAVAEDETDRYHELQDYFREIADNISNAFSTSAQKTGGEAQLKWVTDGDCNIEIVKINTSRTQDDSFSETIGALLDKGYNEPDKIYMIWTEANLVCGIADFITDDNPDPDLNYSSSGVVSRYNRIDRSCWGKSELHEILHSMGAVQKTSPHSTGRGHCYDGSEAMCYGDGGAIGDYEPCDSSHHFLLDCNNDDYFSANPDPGSYLDNHWNLFNSNFLVTNKTKLLDPDDNTPPPAASNFKVYDIGQTTAKFKWTLEKSDDIAKTRLYISDKLKVNMNSVSESTWVNNLQPYTDYFAQVVTVDANGNQAYSNKVYFKTLATPSSGPSEPGKLGSIVPYNLQIKQINGSYVEFTAMIDRVPDEDIYYEVRRSNGVGYTGYTFSPSNTPKTYTFVDRVVYPQSVVHYYIRLVSSSKGVVASSATVPLNFTGTFESNAPPSPTGGTISKDPTNYYNITYDMMSDDSGLVHHYNYSVTGPGGYSYISGDSLNVLSPSPQLVAGNTYTVQAWVTDIWGNVSTPSINNYVVP